MDTKVLLTVEEEAMEFPVNKGYNLFVLVIFSFLRVLKMFSNGNHCSLGHVILFIIVLFRLFSDLLSWMKLLLYKVL